MRKTFIVLAVVVVIAGLAGYFVWRKLSTSSVDTSGWQVYANHSYRFQLKYPTDWRFAVRGGLESQMVGFEIGYPLTEFVTATSSNPDLPFLGVTPSYVLDGSVGEVSATATAKSLAETAAADFKMKFAKEYDTKISAYDAYEFYGVDKGKYSPKTELIFVNHSTTAMTFEFPVAETPADQYNASPTENNAIAREIINTLQFTK